MKCPTCQKGIMKRIESVMSPEKVPYEAFRCPKCGEEILTMPQLKKLADRYKRLRKAKEVTFSQWGNSLAVRIPHEIADELKIKSGKQGLIIKDKEGIKILVR